MKLECGTETKIFDVNRTYKTSMEDVFMIAFKRETGEEGDYMWALVTNSQKHKKLFYGSKNYRDKGFERGWNIGRSNNILRSIDDFVQRYGEIEVVTREIW